MQRSRRLERKRLLQREYGKQSSKQEWLEGGRLGILVEQLQNCRHWLLSPHALTCVWHSRCPLTCPLLGPLLPLSCCCLGWSLLSHLEQNTGSWRRLSGQGHVHAHVHCGLHNRHFTLRENGGSNGASSTDSCARPTHPSPPLSLASVQQLKRKQGELHKETSSCSLAALVVETVQFLPF